MKMQQERSVLAALGTAAVWLGVGCFVPGRLPPTEQLLPGSGSPERPLAQTAAAVAAARAAGLDQAGLGLVRPGTGGLAPVVFCLVLALGSCLAEGPGAGALLCPAERGGCWPGCVCVPLRRCVRSWFSGGCAGACRPLGRWSVGMQAVLFAAAHGTGRPGCIAWGLAWGWAGCAAGPEASGPVCCCTG